MKQSGTVFQWSELQSMLRQQPHRTYCDVWGLRRDLFLRAGRRCAYCGDVISKKQRTLDHWQPRSAGGSDEASNLKPCCRECNRLKADRTPDEFFQFLSGMCLRVRELLLADEESRGASC